MELAQFTPIARRMMDGLSIDVHFGAGSAFSLPVAMRRDETQYDAMFLFEKPDKPAGTQSPRPYAWMLLDAATNKVALFCRCDLVDFMPGDRYPAGCLLPMEEPKSSVGKKKSVMQDKLLAAYEEIREFAFEENLTRPQAAAVSTYKEMFQKLIYPSHYPFYHALSPAFFHWLRMPLPKEALMDPKTPMSELQSNGYQLLILENLQQLVRQFQDKIAGDGRKDALLDEMHRELQEYKGDLLNTLTLSLERDIIQTIDHIGKAVDAYRKKDPSAEEYGRLLSMLSGVETDLTDLLYRHGVEPYTVDGLDVGRQKIVSTVPTEEMGRDKTIAARLARGWEKGDRIIRPERVSVYVYKEGESE